MTTRRLGMLLLSVGVTLVSSGAVVAWTGGDESSEPPAVSQTAPSATTTMAPPPTTTTSAGASTTNAAPTTTSTVSAATTLVAATTTAAAPTTTAPPIETVESFVAVFREAVDAGDVAFVLERLHPVVVEGYGVEVCNNFVEREVMLLREYQLVGDVTGPTIHTVSTPAGTATITEFFSGPVTFRFQNQPFDATAQFGRLDGVMYWLGSCS